MLVSVLRPQPLRLRRPSLSSFVHLLDSQLCRILWYPRIHRAGLIDLSVSLPSPMQDWPCLLQKLYTCRTFVKEIVMKRYCTKLFSKLFKHCISLERCLVKEAASRTAKDRDR